MLYSLRSRLHLAIPLLQGLLLVLSLLCFPRMLHAVGLRVLCAGAGVAPNIDCKA